MSSEKCNNRNKRNKSVLEKHKDAKKKKKMDHEEHLYQLNSLIINLKGRPSVNYIQKKTAAQQASRCEETNSSKQYILFPNLVKKANNFKSALNNEYIRLLKIGTLMTLALWHLTVAAGMRSQQEIIKIDSCQAS